MQKKVFLSSVLHTSNRASNGQRSAQVNICDYKGPQFKIAQGPENEKSPLVVQQ